MDMQSNQLRCLRQKIIYYVIEKTDSWRTIGFMHYFRYGLAACSWTAIYVFWMLKWKLHRSFCVFSSSSSEF
jgi:hypothetical protein